MISENHVASLNQNIYLFFSLKTTKRVYFGRIFAFILQYSLKPLRGLLNNNKLSLKGEIKNKNQFNPP